MMPERIVIVGGGQAGGRVAQILAGSPANLDIALIGLEPHPPYNRPPLSKGVLLGKSELKDCVIWPQGDATAGRVRFYPGRRAESLDIHARHVITDDGARLDYDKLVLATGSRVRRHRFQVRNATASSPCAPSMMPSRSHGDFTGASVFSS